MAHVNMIHTVLIANRGEIALRIQRTAKEMGFRTVAVYSQGDADDVFVKEADMAVALQGHSSSETYLDTQQILQACVVSGANAIHPGYGFLSENAEFAQAVKDAGLIWVGPSPDAIAKMGDKLSAKGLMATAGVPILKTVTVSAEQKFESADFQQQVNELSFPLLVKASAGGGGKGMRVIENMAELADGISSAQREAKSAFGNETVFLEPWLTGTRHVEIQILGDEHGNVVHCFERECSIQRRHQKIIEEAPSIAVNDEIRQCMGDAAVAAANAIGYYSTGTVEFLLSGNDFYFLEVNTRLQVEHPVTEAITGLDLVREQFNVAQGEALGFCQQDLSINGHAIEARLYAENPANDFLPSPGTIASWQPNAINGVRFDTGVEAGSTIGIEFDPMVAKVIAHAPTRKEAAAKLARALTMTRLQGITSNKDFLVEVLNTSAFLQGDTTTDFIERIKPTRQKVFDQTRFDYALLAISLVRKAQQENNAKVLTTIAKGWGNSKMPLDTTQFTYQDVTCAVGYRPLRNGGLSFFVGDTSYRVQVHQATETHVDFLVNGLRMNFDVSCKGNDWFVHGPLASFDIKQVPRFQDGRTQVKEGDLTAPMPCVVRKIMVEEGAIVQAGQAMVVLESMKMELEIKAPRDGIVASINVEKGSNADSGEILISLEDMNPDTVESSAASSEETKNKTTLEQA